MLPAIIQAPPPSELGELELALESAELDDGEWDSTDESLADVWRKAKALYRNPTFKKVARGVITGAGGLAGVGLAQVTKPDLRPYGGVIGSALGGTLANLLIMDETEFLDEWDEDVGESVIAQMEYLGALATETDSDAEADEFVAALVPLATRLAPKAASLITRAAPNLIRSATKVARVLRRSPQTRQLVRAMPHMVRSATKSLARQVVSGKKPTPRRASRTVMRQVRRTIASPRVAGAAVGRNVAINRRLLAQNRMLKARMARARQLLA